MTDETLHSSPQKERSVLYEELAEYYYTSIATNRLVRSNVEIETAYHIKNLILLSLYFDYVLIASATVYNARDPFISKVIDSVLKHRRVREMLQTGTLKILGWGGVNPQAMFESATGYASSVLGINKTRKELASIKSIFDSGHVISRASNMPDQNLAERYKERLESTTCIRDEKQMEKVFSVVDEQFEKTGSLIAIELIPSLEEALLTQEVLDVSKLELFGTTIEHMKEELDDIWVYSPFLAPTFVRESANVAVASPRAFLLSPILFGSFLSNYIDGRTFQMLVNENYNKLYNLKNGDWSRFKNAYHSAVVEVSSALELSMHVSERQLMEASSKEWVDRILGQIQNSNTEMDIATFIESIGSLGGAVLAIPYIKPLGKMIGTLFGKKATKWAAEAKNKRNSKISPFILKLENAYIS